MAKLYECRFVNPKTSEEQAVTVMAEPPAPGACLHAHVQALVRPAVGFMYISAGVRELPLQ
jgi:hypothetical protein